MLQFFTISPDKVSVNCCQYVLETYFSCLKTLNGHPKKIRQSRVELGSFCSWLLVISHFLHNYEDMEIVDWIYAFNANLLYFLPLFQFTNRYHLKISNLFEYLKEQESDQSSCFLGKHFSSSFGEVFFRIWRDIGDSHYMISLRGKKSDFVKRRLHKNSHSDSPHSVWKRFRLLKYRTVTWVVELSNRTKKLPPAVPTAVTPPQARITGVEGLEGLDPSWTSALTVCPLHWASKDTHSFEPAVFVLSTMSLEVEAANFRTPSIPSWTRMVSGLPATGKNKGEHFREWEH